MNLTYIVSGVGIVWAIVGMAFGWIDGATGSGVILASLAAFGARKSQVTTVQGIGGRKSIW